MGLWRAKRARPRESAGHCFLQRCEAPCRPRSDHMRPRVLVTGGNGNLGEAVARLLARVGLRGARHGARRADARRVRLRPDPGARGPRRRPHGGRRPRRGSRGGRHPLRGGRRDRRRLRRRTVRARWTSRDRPAVLGSTSRARCLRCTRASRAQGEPGRRVGRARRRTARRLPRGPGVAVTAAMKAALIPWSRASPRSGRRSASRSTRSRRASWTRRENRREMPERRRLALAHAGRRSRRRSLPALGRGLDRDRRAVCPCSALEVLGTVAHRARLVVVSHYDRRRWLAEALDSIAAQTWRDFEVDRRHRRRPARLATLVERSPPRTPARSMRASCGAPRTAASRRRATPACRRAGRRCIAYLDDDDLWPPDHLERLSAALDRAPGAELAYGDARSVVSAVDAREGPPTRRGRVRDRARRSRCRSTATTSRATTSSCPAG